MKNKFISGFLIGLMSISLIGCSGLLGKNGGIFGKSAKKESAAAAKIDTTTENINKTDKQRLTSIGAWAGGVDYALDKATNKEPAVTTAQEINERVKSLANKPNFDELKEVYGIIDSLLTNQITGQRLLERKDKEIIKLQSTIDTLQEDRETAVSNYRNIAESSAKQSDSYKATLSQMDSFWGFGAIGYGIKKLISRLALTLGIMAVLFIVLRIFAATNPIAGSIFSIFEQIGSWAINLLKSICPKAASISGLVPHEDYQGYKDTLHKVVDAFETVKLKEDTLRKTDPTSVVGIDDLSTEISKAFTPEDSQRVTDAKKALLWKS